MPVTQDADATFPCRVEKKVFFTEIRKAWGEQTRSVLFSWARGCATEPPSAHALPFLCSWGRAHPRQTPGWSERAFDVDRVLAFCPAGAWSNVDLGPGAGSPASPWPAHSGRGSPASSWKFLLCCGEHRNQRCQQGDKKLEILQRDGVGGSQT